jgi:RimJ/RimL family protein N-acetyltransferase
LPTVSEAPEQIRTQRLVATRLTRSDLADFQRFYADPEVMATLSPDGRPWPAKEAADLFERHLEHWREHGFGTWVFRDATDSSFMGRAGLRAIDIGAGPEIELYYGVASDRWGEGFATEMARALIDVALGALGGGGLVAFTLPTNHASRRVLEKCGFHRDGCFVHAGLEHEVHRLSRG